MVETVGEGLERVQRGNATREFCKEGRQSGMGTEERGDALTFGGCGEPHLSVLEDFVEFRAGVLVGACTAIRMVAVPAFGPKPEENAVLGRFRTLAMHASVRAREAAFAFL